MENKQQEPILQMNLDYDGGNILKETVRWSRFLSIVGIIGLSIMVLLFALAGSMLLGLLARLAPGLEDVGGALVMGAIIGVLLILGFVVYMLYRFSVLTRKGIEQQDQAAFSEGIKCLKTYFVTSGVLAILSLLANVLSLTKLFHS